MKLLKKEISFKDWMDLQVYSFNTVGRFDLSQAIDDKKERTFYLTDLDTKRVFLIDCYTFLDLLRVSLIYNENQAVTEIKRFINNDPLSSILQIRKDG